MIDSSSLNDADNMVLLGNFRGRWNPLLSTKADRPELMALGKFHTSFSKSPSEVDSTLEFNIEMFVDW